MVQLYKTLLIMMLSNTDFDYEFCMIKKNKQTSKALCTCFSIREFLMYLQRYKSFFAVLPEMLCETEGTLEDSTCWSGDGVVKR